MRFHTEIQFLFLEVIKKKKQMFLFQDDDGSGDETDISFPTDKTATQPVSVSI